VSVERSKPDVAAGLGVAFGEGAGLGEGEGAGLVFAPPVEPLEAGAGAGALDCTGADDWTGE